MRSRIRVGVAASLVALAMSAVLAACGGAEVATPDDPVLARGQQLYNSQCASCHGRSGGGGVGPGLADVSESLSFDEQVEIVRDGSGSGMPGFDARLDDAELDAVVRYTREVL